jgi:hypothetical protein
MNIPELIAGLIVDGTGAWLIKRARWQRKREARARAWERAVDARLAALSEGDFPSADDAAAAGVPLEEGERVFGMVCCERYVPKTVTRYIVHYQTGDLDVRHVTENVTQSEGLGVLVITDKRLVFHKPGKGTNWTCEWGSLLGWDVADHQLIIEPTSGDPQIFDTSISRCLGARFVDGDIRCAAFVLHKARPH